jgi:transcriptional antiterminator
MTPEEIVAALRPQLEAMEKRLQEFIATAIASDRAKRTSQGGEPLTIKELANVTSYSRATIDRDRKLNGYRFEFDNKRSTAAHYLEWKRSRQTVTAAEEAAMEERLHRLKSRKPDHRRDP